jgi:hypothetical protein
MMSLANFSKFAASFSSSVIIAVRQAVVRFVAKQHFPWPVFLDIRATGQVTYRLSHLLRNRSSSRSK